MFGMGALYMNEKFLGWGFGISMMSLAGSLLARASSTFGFGHCVGDEDTRDGRVGRAAAGGQTRSLDSLIPDIVSEGRKVCW